MAYESLLLVWPILRGQEEAWRRDMQEIQTFRRVAYAESRQRLGIRKECIYLAHRAQGRWAILAIEADKPDNFLATMAASEHPFDRWFVAQLQEWHGTDLTGLTSALKLQLILAWQAGDGPADNPTASERPGP